jgi:hypothetical protein
MPSRSASPAHPPPLDPRARRVAELVLNNIPWAGPWAQRGPGWRTRRRSRRRARARVRRAGRRRWRRSGRGPGGAGSAHSDAPPRQPLCRENLECRIGAQLEDASLDDLLVPNLGYHVDALRHRLRAADPGLLHVVDGRDRDGVQRRRRWRMTAAAASGVTHGGTPSTALRSPWWPSSWTGSSRRWCRTPT